MGSDSCGRVAPAFSRREILEKSGFGLGAIALGQLLGLDARAASPKTEPSDPLAPRRAHFAAKAKSVIFFFMQGGPSQVDTFDPKPVLSRLDGQSLPGSFRSEDLNLQFIKAGQAKLMGTRRSFGRHGASGLEISDLFPNLSRHADDLAVIRSCFHESFVHGPALLLMNTGHIRMGFPSMGSWVLYGLGSESANLPSYILMSDGGIRSSKSLFGSGFLPAVYQGTLLRADGGTLIENLNPPEQVTAEDQRLLLARVNEWNRQHLESREDDSRLTARIRAYELAFRMQMAAPEVADLNKEPEAVRRAYGLENQKTAKFARMCLLSRRMVERGVRFIQLINNDWDGHSECDDNHVKNAAATDVPIAALIADLKQRGLLDSTLLIWAGEFGRTPVMQGSMGRDHSPYGFSMWMAGGGVRGGKTIGATDELGFRAVEDKVHISDIHSTILALLGLDHLKLTFHFQGRDFRLTDVGGHTNLAPRLVRA